MRSILSIMLTKLLLMRGEKLTEVVENLTEVVENLMDVVENLTEVAELAQTREDAKMCRGVTLMPKRRTGWEVRQLEKGCETREGEPTELAQVKTLEID